MSEPDIYCRTYAQARMVQRRTYDAMTLSAAETAAQRAERFEMVAADARELARMLDRCALAAETAERSTA